MKGYNKNYHESSWICTIHDVASTFNSIDFEAEDNIGFLNFTHRHAHGEQGLDESKVNEDLVK